MDSCASKFLRVERSNSLPDESDIMLNAISVQWNQLINENQGNLSDILYDLLIFFKHAKESDKIRFCTENSLEQLWNISISSKIIQNKIYSLEILAFAIPYNTENLKFIHDSQYIDVLLQNLKSSNEKFCDVSLGVISAICSLNEEFIPYLFDNGIIQLMNLLSTQSYYGSMVVILASCPGEHIEEVLDLASLCITSDFSLNVKSAFTAFGQIASNASPEDAECISNEVMTRIISNIEEISKINDGSVAKEFFMLLNLYDAVPLEISSVITQIIINCVDFDDENIHKTVISGIDTYNHFFDCFNEEKNTSFIDLIIQVFGQLSYSCMKKVAQFLLVRFPYRKILDERVCKIFGKFMTDADIGGDCIYAFTVMMEIFKDSDIMQTLILNYVGNIYDGLNSSDENILEASVHFIEVFKSIREN